MTSVALSQGRRQVARFSVSMVCVLLGCVLGGVLLAAGCRRATEPAQPPADAGQQQSPADQSPAEQAATQSPAETQPQPEAPGKSTEETAGEGQSPGSEASGQPGTGAAGEELPGATPAGPAGTEVPGEGLPAGEVRTQPGEQPGGAGSNSAAGAAEVEVVEGMDFVNVPAPAFMPEAVPLPEAEAQTEADMKPYTETIPGTEVKFEMVPIRGGKFLMGSPESEPGRKPDEGPQHEVVVDPFWMGKYEVTWQEYELWAMKLDMERRRALKQEAQPQDKIADAVAMPTPPYSDMTFGMGKDGYPAICMTQFAAKMYCKWLSAKTGRYYRLPTEAEWEYACRAGTTTAYSFGDDASALGEYGWYFDNSDDKYHKVGQKKPNPWGLYDMHGNVAEWVLDQHVPNFYAQLAGKPVENPLALATTIYPRVVRGGSWDSDAEQLRSAARIGSTPDWKMQDPQIPQSVWYLTDANFVGFRVVRPLRKPTAEEAKKYEVDEAQLRDYREWYEAEMGQL